MTNGKCTCVTKLISFWDIMSHGEIPITQLNIPNDS